MKRLLEIACFNAESAVIAFRAGADRLELCADYAAGGITPPEQVIREVLTAVTIPVHVIIRSRGGDFVYSDLEMDAMLESVSFCRDHGASGIVFGALTSTEEVDIAACRKIKQAAGPLSLTFHRAIDGCADLNKAVEQVIDMGFHRILSSGGANNALEGMSTLQELQQKYGQGIILMPGGGVRSSNISHLLKTGCSEFHSAAIIGPGNITNAEEVRRLQLVLNG